MNDPITSFDGEYDFLSNFHLATPLLYMGHSYATAEHAYQAAKFTGDKHAMTLVRQCMTPGRAKKCAKAMYAAINPQFVERKLLVMEQILWIKFRDPVLCGKLLATGERELIEGNTWGDRYWGVHDGQGENHLGRLLMKVRSGISNVVGLLPALKVEPGRTVTQCTHSTAKGLLDPEKPL